MILLEVRKMTEKCKKCGKELSPDWIVCPICKTKVKLTEQNMVLNEYTQFKIERMERIKQMSKPFNEKYFNPVFLLMVVLYIFTTPITVPLFGILLPFFLILASVLLGFTLVYLIVSLNLRRIKFSQ